MIQPIKLCLQVFVPKENIPTKLQFKTWARQALKHCRITTPYELTLRIVSQNEIQELNKQYRNIDKPTNILSFQDEIIPGCPRESLGELVICPTIIETEAKLEQKTVMNHWAHIIIHGILHLLGYDHQTEIDAKTMETLEIEILQTLKIPNPYR
jgi:probable rRNA maturation factor